MREIKMIWDFKGPNALPTAQHHVVHLKEFVNKENIPFIACKTETISPMHTIAYLATAETHVEYIRKYLKPHRGQLYTSSN